MAIASEFRIVGNTRVEEVKSSGKILQSVSFGVCFLKNSLNLSRFTVVVSTKVSKFAVHRNRIKRAILEAVRQNMADIPSGNDFVFLAKSNITSKVTDEIMNEVSDFFKKNSDLITNK